MRNLLAGGRARTRLGLVLVGAVVLLLGALPAAADTSPQTPPFSQNWTNTGLITANDNWSGVAGVEGYLGQDITTTTGTDPQTLLTTSVGRERPRRDREPDEHRNHERRRRRVRRDHRPGRRAPGLRHGRRAVPARQPQHDRARERPGRLQPARHRRDDRQRGAAGRAPVPRRRRAATSPTSRPRSWPTRRPVRASRRSSRR